MIQPIERKRHFVALWYTASELVSETFETLLQIRAMRISTLNDNPLRYRLENTS